VTANTAEQIDQYLCTTMDSQETRIRRISAWIAAERQDAYERAQNDLATALLFGDRTFTNKKLQLAINEITRARKARTK
jgi:hypothetical protein